MFTELQNIATEVPGAFYGDGRGAVGFDPGLARPYRDDRGQVWVDVTTGIEPVRDARGRMVTNKAGFAKYQRKYEPQLVADRVRNGLPVLQVNNALALRKDQWIVVDGTVSAAARSRLRAYADLRASSTLGGFDGMATPILEHELVNDPGEAIADMDGLSEGRGFAPSFGLQGLPLPISHSSFYLSSRFLAASRSKGQPQDTMRMEMAGRRVGELIERMTLGTVTPFAYGDSADYNIASKVYGYMNHPHRLLKTITAPTGANTDTTVGEILDMRSTLYGYNFYGPFMVYHSPNWDRWLDDDYAKGTYAQGYTSPSTTLRTRLMAIEGIQGIRRMDFMDTDNKYHLLMVQMTSDVAQAINGMEITTIQWETKGGMQLNFKTLGIQVPRIRSVYVSGTASGALPQIAGIMHASTA